MTLVLPTDLTTTQAAIWLDQQLFAGKPIHNTRPLRSEANSGLIYSRRRCAGRLRKALACGWRRSQARYHLTRCYLISTKTGIHSPQQTNGCGPRWAKQFRWRIPHYFAVIRISDDHTLWLQKCHHIIMDATSRRLLSERTAHRYRALRFDEPLSALDAIPPEELLDEERRDTASKAMRLTVPIGWSSSRIGPDLSSRSTGLCQSDARPPTCRTILSGRPFLWCNYRL